MMRALLLLSLFPAISFGDVMRIGAIASLQGGAAEQGRSWLEGAELAVEELNREGKGVRLIVEDDETRPAKAATAFQKLSKIDKVSAVIGGTWDFLAQAVFPLAERDRLLFISPSNPKEIIADTAGERSFTIGISLAAEAKAIREFLFRRNFRRAVIVSVQVPFGTFHSEMIRGLFRDAGVEILQEIELSLEDQLSSFKTAAQRAKRQSPDVIYLVADYNQLDIFAAELQNLKFQPTVLTVQHLSGAYELSKGNDERYRNVYAVYPSYDRDRFDRKFMQKFAKSPQVFAPEGYDAVKFIYGYFSAADPGKFSYQGLKGEYRIVPGSRSLIEDRAEIVQIQGGELRVVQ
jgi:branched-chain amino acid transport system substrate-binding protein